MAHSSSKTSSSSSAAFAKHKVAQANNNTSSTTSGAKMPLTARLLIFVFIPTFTGLCGLGISYLQQLQGKYLNSDNNDRVNFDRDFVSPFLLGLAFVIVIGFQTGGFSSSERRG
ncbi:hypothetical protein ACHAXR_000144, partial [Thalassiosira sp. AJA248-18]